MQPRPPRAHTWRSCRWVVGCQGGRCRAGWGLAGGQPACVQRPVVHPRPPQASMPPAVPSAAAAWPTHRRRPSSPGSTSSRQSPCTCTPSTRGRAAARRTTHPSWPAGPTRVRRPRVLRVVCARACACTRRACRLPPCTPALTALPACPPTRPPCSHPALRPRGRAQRPAHGLRGAAAGGCGGLLLRVGGCLGGVGGRSLVLAPGGPTVSSRPRRLFSTSHARLGASRPPPGFTLPAPHLPPHTHAAMRPTSPPQSPSAGASARIRRWCTKRCWPPTGRWSTPCAPACAGRCVRTA